jgi:hypothetical protein
MKFAMSLMVMDTIFKFLVYIYNTNFLNIHETFMLLMVIILFIYYIIET